jgi:hypothetical protein
MVTPDTSPSERVDRGTDSSLPSADSSQRVGGFAFYLSLALLLPTGILLFVLAIIQIRHAELKMAAVFLMSCLCGATLAKGIIRDHLSVLLHEFKHRLIANLVGNKFKGMKINKNSGHVVYTYTKKTAHYNAFISLAPYIVPIFTLVTSLIALVSLRGDPLMILVIVGLGYGADLLLNVRDISPIQTDISLIRGGYSIGLLYILAWNLMIAALVLAWAFQGIAGIGHLIQAVSEAFFELYFSISGRSPSD